MATTGHSSFPFVSTELRDEISLRVISQFKGPSYFINFEKTIKKIEAEGILHGSGITD